MHHYVIRRIQPLTLEAIHQHGDSPIMLRASHAAAAVLAGEEPALAVARVTIGVIGRRAKGAHRPALLAPAQDAIVGNIGEEQITSIAEPDRPLGPAPT